MKTSKILGLLISAIGVASLVLGKIEEEQCREEIKAELKEEILTELKEES